jgi:transposase
VPVETPVPAAIYRARLPGDAHGNVVLPKRVSRKQVLPLLAQLPPCLVGLEACGGSHYWAREITKLGHTVKLMAPQAVKPYVQGNKTDGRDAEGICEAASRPRVRPVAINSAADQDMQTLHRVREHCVKMRTALANQLRGVLGEYGFVVPQGIDRWIGILNALLLPPRGQRRVGVLWHGGAYLVFPPYPRFCCEIFSLR